MENAPENSPASSRRKPPVFLIGSPRSGTTLLHQMFDHHPAFALPFESKYIVIFNNNLEEFGDLHDAKNREALIVSIEMFMRHAWLERDHEEWIPGLIANAPRLAQEAKPSYAGVMETVYKYFAEPLLDKLGYEIVNRQAKLNLWDRFVGNTGHKVRWWRPFTHPVGLWDRMKMSVLKRKLRQ